MTMTTTTTTNNNNNGDDPSSCNPCLREQAHEILDFRHAVLDTTTTISSSCDGTPATATATATATTTTPNIDSIRQHIVNDMYSTTFLSPLEFSASKKLRVPLLYCDYTASSRPLKSIDSYIQTKLLPFYGNTHTNSSVTGSQSSALVSESRQIIAELTGAKITGKASTDIVLFCGGNGVTSAVELFIDGIGLKYQCQQQQQQSNSNSNQQSHRP